MIGARGIWIVREVLRCGLVTCHEVDRLYLTVKHKSSSTRSRQAHAHSERCRASWSANSLNREQARIATTPVQRLPPLKSSEYPAFTRGHWEVGRPLVRSVSMLSDCGQPGGESSHVSCRP